MSTDRISKKAGFVTKANLPRGPNDLPLCRWCQQECPTRRNTFCSKPCVHEHKIRSQPGYARNCVEDRDGGICAICNVSTNAVEAELRSIRKAILKERHPKLDFTFHCPETFRNDARWIAACQKYRFKPTVSLDRSLWAADHTVPVVEDGGDCGLDNLRTLCLPCHVEVTAALRKRMAEAKKAAKLAKSNL